MIRNYCAPKLFMTRTANTCTTTIRTLSQRCGVIVTPALRSSAGLIAVAAVVLSACSDAPTVPPGASADPGRTFATTAQVLEAVKAAQNIDDLPSSVGFLTKADWPMAQGQFDCHSVGDVPANVVDPTRTVFGE